MMRIPEVNAQKADRDTGFPVRNAQTHTKPDIWAQCWRPFATVIARALSGEKILLSFHSP
ncbi:hypothetical protein DRB80_10735 [Salmonella enterica]|uniref:Uncharacterized protein n=1 Tax=Salmonella enterica TaxID=28901 RepID=A0A3L2LEL0_SALER|nr:hypothetical protein [Salmonella enterica]EBH8099500.1 hypothetical protein [Salmonella enterica subsp. houtenae serovar O:11:g,z25:-]ECC8718989.1 hypothetical protein [Salmonella enterica subsp. houtenae]ECU4769523.1 hypothetical protein [Salmonella enterica subsp. enterica]EAB1816737.1 hypothetical protein [Salmonella enterica]